MSGTSTVPTRRRKEPRIARVAARPVITCRTGVLEKLFAAENIHTYREMSASLNYDSTSGVHRACNGVPVSAWLIAAIRLRFPEVPYERIFTEGTVDATADAAA
jgi:hypothetical protein